MNAIEERYYSYPLKYFLRGKLGMEGGTFEDLIAEAKSREIKIYNFKRKELLPRLKPIFGFLKSRPVETLLDIGSGRGVFLWPLLDEFRDIEVHACELKDVHVADYEAVRSAGLTNLHIHQESVLSLPFPDASFDVVTILEVLEHLEEPSLAAKEILRVAKTHVLFSVPSKEDDNPEHIQLFDKESITMLFLDAGAKSVNVTYVRGHITGVVAL